MKKKDKLLYICIVLGFILNILLFPVVGLKLFKKASTSLTNLDDMVEVGEINVQSDDYADKTPGSWQVKKSAEWTGRDTASITLNVDSNVYSKGKAKYVMFLMDGSGSISYNTFAIFKNSIRDVIEYLSSSEYNRVALVQFSNEVRTHFTFNDEVSPLLINRVYQINGTTDFGNAFNSAKIIADNYYVHQDDRELIVLFLTDGQPTYEEYNGLDKYQAFKESHPYATVYGIQYQYNDNVTEVDEAIKNVSDYQFLAGSTTLTDIFKQSIDFQIEYYDNFEIIDYIDNDYFEVISESDIKVDIGNIKLEMEDGRQKIIWTMGPDTYLSGANVQMKIDLKLKPQYIDSKGLYPTNEKVEVLSKLPDNSEQKIESYETPVLKNSYNVVYNANYPDGCNSSYNKVEEHYVFEQVQVTSEEPEHCSGYVFSGWQIDDSIEPDISNVFTMPSHDITISGQWLKEQAIIEPEITKNIIDKKEYYDVGDIINYLVTVKNTANYQLNDVVVQENNNKAIFKEGTGYTLLDKRKIKIATIEPNQSINILASYKVSDNDLGTIINEVEIIDAKGQPNYVLNKEKEYKATDSFNILSSLTICKKVDGISDTAVPFQVHITATGYDTWLLIKKDECRSIHLRENQYQIEEVINQDYVLEDIEGDITINNGTLNVEPNSTYSITFKNKYKTIGYFHNFGNKKNILTP